MNSSAPAPLERLRQLMGPAVPLGAPVPWAAAGEEIDFTFPADYRAFIDLYGSVRIHDELLVWSPTKRGWRPGGPGGFAGLLGETTDAGTVGRWLADMHVRWPRQHPYPVYPDPGGLVLWAGTRNGDRCCWLTEGADPDRWPVVVWFGRSTGWERFEGGTAEFLAAVLTGANEVVRELCPPRPGIPSWAREGGWED
jgi:hypothetical protein